MSQGEEAGLTVAKPYPLALVRFKGRQDPCPRVQDLLVREIGRHEDVHVHADELFPRDGGLALRRRRDALALDNVPHSLVAEGVSEIGQGAHNTIIAPGTVLLRHTHHQGLQLLVDRGATRSLALLGSVKLLHHEFAVPAKNRVGLDNLGDFFQGLLAQLLADVRQGLSFVVTQPEAPLNLVAYEAILRDQIFIAHQ
jgi:hypothetical protein